MGEQGIKGDPGEQGPVGAPVLDGTVTDAVTEKLRNDILQEVLKLIPSCKGSVRNNPATSCKEIYECNPTAHLGTIGSVMQQGCYTSLLHDEYCQLR